MIVELLRTNISCKAPSAKYVNCIPEKGSHLFQDVEVHMKMFP